jgi:hypothetical protein
MLDGAASGCPVEVFNALGALVLRARGPRIDVSALPAGVYLARIKTDAGSRGARFVKK